MEANNDVKNYVQNNEESWIQPPITELDLSIYTQKIIDNLYSVIDGNVQPSKKSLAQSWFWEDEWQAGEQKVDAYIHLGQIEEFDSMDDFLKSLRK